MAFRGTRTARVVLMAALLVAGLAAVCFGELMKVPADPGNGFDWPYYLYIPPQVTRSSLEMTLLVMPNNTGWMYDDFSIHERDVQKKMERRGKPFGDELGVPVLMPVFPRPENSHVYTHVLDRDCLTTRQAGLVRLDLQLIAMVDDARSALEDRGIQVGIRFLITGFSAGGSFSNRFALLHPELVRAVAAGGVGFFTLPVADWEGQRLRYAIGISDLLQLTGHPFSAAAYVAIPQFFFVGELDENDPVNTGVGYEDQDRRVIKRLFGNSNGDWWRSAIAVFESVGANVEFKVYPSLGHEYTISMQRDVLKFFQTIIGS